MRTPILHKIETTLQTRVAAETAALAGGACRTMEAYARAVGLIEGLNEALRAMAETEAKWFVADDD